mgnify:CR=1 FL=1
MIPKVSIIIPCYNQAQFLPETLDSVLAQTYENWECIIVNDGSSDNTEEVALEYCKQDDRFVYLPKQNGGLSSARNAGLDAAKGDYVQFLDSDDIILPRKIEKQVQSLENDDVDVCVCHHSMFTTDINQTWENKFSQSVYDLTYQGFMYNWGENFVIAIHSGLFKRAFIEQYNLRFDEKVGALEDWLFWVGLVRSGAKFSELQDKLSLYRVHTSSMTQNKIHMQKNRLRLYFCLYESLSEEEKKDFMQRGVDNLVAYFERSNYNIDAERKAKGYSSAWLHHKGRNKHHLEYWIDYSPEGDHPLGGNRRPVKYVV